jgi:AraC-like DNA-binding protein
MQTDVVCHSSALGRWEMAARQPHPRLRAFVNGYHGFFEATPGPLRRREMPSTDVPVIISFGEPWEITLGPDSPRPERWTSFVGGLHDGWVLSEHRGTAHGMQITLTAVGARMFLGLPMGELTRSVIALDDLLGRDADRLTERLAETPSWDARFDLLDGAIAARLAEAEPPPPDLLHAWTRLRRSDGRVPVAELAAELRCSRRHLTSRFREQLGLPPKALARLLRFDRVVRLLREGRIATWAQAAAEGGYYDQSHLNRDFRAFADATPTELAARLRPDGNGFDV